MKRSYFTWFAAVLLFALAAGSCSDDKSDGGDPTPPTPPGPSTDKSYNKTIDTYLQERYLWNDDYKQLTRDLSQTYVENDNNFLVTTLMKMTTNKLDRKQYQNSNGGTYYAIYSNITRTPKSRVAIQQETRGVNHGVKKEEEYSYGIAGLMLITFTNQSGTPTGEYAICIRAVYPGSNAANDKGVKRGMLIDKVDGKTLTAENVYDYAYELLGPSGSSSLSVTDYVTKSTIQLATRKIYPNPVLQCKVLAGNVGYLVYNSFDAAYDDELLAAIKTLKDAGITDLILDLRYNGGGHVISSKMLSTCIAGNRSENKVFQYYRYNESRMTNYTNTQKQTGHQYDSGKKLFYENFNYGTYYSVDLKQYSLDLQRLYVLTTNSTASASELVINSLRGIDIPVTLIGQKTNGKNVGMEVYKFNDGNYAYEMSPITFQGYNAKNVSDYETGFQVNTAVEEWNNGLVDFGEGDPLVAAALSQITNRTYKAAATATRGMSVNLIPDDQIAIPENPRRPSGMLIIVQESEE